MVPFRALFLLERIMKSEYPAVAGLSRGQNEVELELWISRACGPPPIAIGVRA